MKKKIVAISCVIFMLVAAVVALSVLRDADDVPNHTGTPGESYASTRIFGTNGDGGYTSRPTRLATPLSIGEILEGQDPRGGYILAPTHVGRSGVDPASSFVLRTPYTPYGDVQITIDGQDAPDISPGDDPETFIITPALALTSNSVYVFRMARENAPEITWAFQTAVLFEITGTLPRNESTNVPVRTGIEINFSHGDEINISEHFQIYPHVEGQFIYRDSAAIFMPTTALAYSTVYTVTLRAGVSYMNEATGADRIFSFETAPAPDAPSRPAWEPTIHFHNRYVEFPSFAAPTVHFWLNFRRAGNAARPPIDFSLYRIDDRAAAIDAVTRLTGVHFWSQFSDGNHLVDTTELTRIAHETVTEPQQGDGWSESYTLPDALPAGFYVLEAELENSTSQVIIQITDTAVQIFADDDRAIVWINDMHTGGAIANATVYDPITRRTFDATSYGIAVIERDLSAGEYLIIENCVVFIHSGGFQHFWHNWWGGWDDDWDMPTARRFGGGWWDSPTSNNDYWTALQLDRTLFQRDDTVNLWGFVQPRRPNEQNISHVTAVLTERSWWHWGDGNNDTLHRVNIPVQHGAYFGEIRLPHVDPGSYEIAIYHGDVLLSSMFFTVMDYVKPPYQMTVSASAAAIFVDEEVTFTAHTAFFEGTPVPDLNISYNFWGWGLNTPSGGRGDTDTDGILEVSARPTAQATTRETRVQGQRTMTFSAETTLPEIGWTHQQSTVRVFINDIHVDPRASRDGANATLSVDVQNITLDRINDGTATRWNDFFDGPRAGQNLSVEIAEIWWERERDGEFYDHVTRQVRPRYRHIRRETSLETFTLTTNADGTAERSFTVPDRERRSYQARITTTDGNGREIHHTVHIGRDWDSFFNQANDNRLFLYGANPDGYDIGDPVELTIMRGAESVEQGNFLFVVVQGGVMSYHIGTNPLNFTFGEQHVPNAQVFAVHFNGHTYNTGGEMAQRLRFNPEDRELLIEITTCAEYYRPGETPTFTIRTTDLAGNPKPANVNISLVDEALFALMDYEVDTLAMLYANVSDDLRFAMSTHSTFVSDGIDDVQADGVSLQRDFTAQTAEFFTEDFAAEEADAGGGGGGDDRVRERFEDTAIFASVRTNASGTAVISFPLPDNITSWRATASAISNDLFAGNTVQNVRVTLPMFLHYTLNRTFLTGDVPTIGVNAFGTALSGGETVEFTVYREDAPNDVRRGTGVAFERVNIPLWEMTDEGHGAIIIRATVAGRGDAVRHEYQVVQSHRRVDTARFYEVTPGTQFDINQTGLTNITFTDHGRGQFLNDMFALRHTWWSGVRIEGLVARREANALIRTHFPDVYMFGDAPGFDIADYQTQSGGIAVLPHSDAELAVTVKLLPFVQEEINLHAMRGYLRNIFENSPTDNKMLALYGLALLGEPVLHDLQRYAMLEDLSVRNTAYVALAFAALGETHVAREIFNERISPQTVRVGALYRVDAGANRAQILDATSASALLAAAVGAPQAIGLHNYAATNRAEVIGWPRWGGRRERDTAALNAQLLLNLETLNFISREINNHTDTEATITYTLFGETVTRELGHGGSFTLRIPAQNFNQFRLTSIAGEVGAVSIVRVPLDEMETIENDITVRREFFRGTSTTPATTFSQDEIIRVQITVDYSARDLAGTYVITDFLPAGLTLVQGSARIGRGSDVPGRHAWAQSEGVAGQRVTFFDHSDRFNREHIYYYYARVINPGTFRAEGTIVQSLGAREYMVVGTDAVVTIE